MKNTVSTILMMFIAIVCWGKKTYTLSKTDFVAQFTNRNVTKTEGDVLSQLSASGNTATSSIYCFDENGKKVWLSYNNNTQLTLKLRDNSSKIVLLCTVTTNNDTIYAVEYNVWWKSGKVSTYNLNDVQSFHINRKFQERDMPYFDPDSSRQLTK